LKLTNEKSEIMNEDSVSRELKRIEEYISNDFLPIFFSGFKKMDYIFSKKRHHKTYFEYKNIQYVIEILAFNDGYEGYLYILDGVGAEMVFSKKGKLEEFFLAINKNMKEYRLSNLYK
jgi:hypothetical protein